MRFHLIMPVFNGAAFLDAAIRSVRAQSWDDWRLTILDAESQDGSDKIAARHCEDDSRISLRTGPDAGQYDALRQGFDHADGDILGWLNADDLLAPWAFASAAPAFREGRKWVTGQPAIWDAEGRMIAMRPIGFIGQHFLANGWCHDDLLGCLQQESTFFSKTLWDGLSEREKDRFATLKLAGDFYLWKRFAEKAAPTVLPVALGGFRVHGSNRSRVDADAYLDETGLCGAKRLPRWLARFAKNTYDMLNACAALIQFRRTAAHFHAELDET